MRDQMWRVLNPGRETRGAARSGAENESARGDEYIPRSQTRVGQECPTYRREEERRGWYAIAKEHLLRTKGGGPAGPLSVGYSTPAGGFGGKTRRFSALEGWWASWAGGFLGARARGGSGEAWARGVGEAGEEGMCEDGRPGGRAGSGRQARPP